MELTHLCIGGALFSFFRGHQEGFEVGVENERNWKCFCNGFELFDIFFPDHRVKGTPLSDRDGRNNPRGELRADTAPRSNSDNMDKLMYDVDGWYVQDQDIDAD